MSQTKQVELQEEVRKVVFEVEISGDFNSTMAGIALLDGVESVEDVTNEKTQAQQEAVEFPEHKGSMILTHNDHKTSYEELDIFLETIKDYYDDDSWANTDSKERAIKTDNLWTLHWYPETPVGFNVIHGATFEEVMEALKKEQE